MTQRVLTFKGLRPFFDDVACFDSQPKITLSKGKMLELLFNRYSLNPQRCVMIGDTILDMQGGRYAGAETVAVLYGYGQRQALLDEKPDWLVKDESWHAVESMHGNRIFVL